MKRPRPIKFFASIDMLDWNSNVNTKVLEAETMYDRFDSEIIMKSMNLGDLEKIPSPFEGKITTYWDIWRDLFKECRFVPWSCSFVKKIESEVILGTIKFVVIDDWTNMKMKWTFS